MLQSQGLRAAYLSGGGTAASISYRANYSSTTDASSYTFTSADIGTATDRSIVVVAVHATRGSSFSVSSVTIGGVSATQVISSGSTLVTSIWYASGVTGTTGNIVVTMSGATTRCLVGVYALYNLRSNTPIDSDQTFAISGTGLTRTINTKVDGVIIGAGSSSSSGRTYTWTGATENYDTVVEAAASFSAASTTTSSNSVTTVSYTIAGGAAGITYALASWR